jgi:hypothetical protein
MSCRRGGRAREAPGLAQIREPEGALKVPTVIEQWLIRATNGVAPRLARRYAGIAGHSLFALGGRIEPLFAPPVNAAVAFPRRFRKVNGRSRGPFPLAGPPSRTVAGPCPQDCGATMQFAYTIRPVKPCLGRADENDADPR